MGDIHEKISKLLAMAHDGRGNEHEEEAALRQAEKLMRKHNIDVAELQDRTGIKPVYVWKSISIPAGKPPVHSPVRWFGMMISSIGKFTDTKVSYHRDPQHGLCAKFSGDEVDIEYAGWLCKTLRDAVRAQSGSYPGGRAEKESFRKGFVMRVSDRMSELLQERKAALEKAKTSTGNALMVVDNKLALRDEQFGEQRYARSVSFSLHQHAAKAGSDAGSRAALNRPIGNRESQARISGA